MKINRMLTNICALDLQATKQFYMNLFDFNPDYDSDWFVHLISKARNFELGILNADHELVPLTYRGKPQGVYLTFVVDDGNGLYQQAVSSGYEVVQKPELTFYGQMRFLLRDPAGSLVDISTPMSE